MTQLSTKEAAFVAQVSTSTVHRAIDRDEVESGGSRRQRELGVPEVLYLRVRRELTSVLSKRARKQLYRSFRVEFSQKGNLGGFRRRFEVGPVHVEVGEAVRSVAERMGWLEEARRHVVEDEEVRGGEPVVRGTRIPVYLLAELTKQGATREELLEDYPVLSPEALESALVYAETHPRRGRKPKTPPWRRSSTA